MSANTKQNEQELVGDVVSSLIVKTIEGYVEVNFEVSSSSIGFLDKQEIIS